MKNYILLNVALNLGEPKSQDDHILDLCSADRNDPDKEMKIYAEKPNYSKQEKVHSELKGPEEMLNIIFLISVS